MPNTEKQIESIAEYLKLLKELNDRYPYNGWWDKPSHNTFLFRGVSKSDYKLIPKVFRDTQTKITMGDSEKTFTNRTYLSDSKEFDILRHFITEASAYKHDVMEEDYLQWAEIAQHYGVPTRFLDWTTNPLVALYFTCLSNRTEDGAVWVLHTKNYMLWLAENEKRNPEDLRTRGYFAEQLIKNEGKGEDLPEYPDLIIPRYVDQRMSAQGSYFMYWGKREDPLEDMIGNDCYMVISEVPTGIKVLSDEQFKKFILKIKVRKTVKQPIYRELDMLGINAKSLFPGLDGIGQYIDRKYTFDYDEHLF